MKKIESWADITIGQYQEMMLIETENEITKFVETVAICLDIDPAEIRTLSLSDFRELQTKMSFISKDPDPQVINKFEIDGVEYGLIPDMSIISAGEFIDAEQFKIEPMTNLHFIVALIFRPITKNLPDGSYEIELHKAQGFEKRANLFRDKVSIEVVLGAVLFFSLSATELSTSFLDSLLQKMNLNQVAKTTKMKKTRTPTKPRKPKRSKNNSDSTIS